MADARRGGSGANAPGRTNRDVMETETSEREVQGALESLLFYFKQLEINISYLINDVASGQADLKPILATYGLIAAKQQGLMEELARHYDLVKSVDVFPTDKLPTHYVPGKNPQPQLALETLMRKKPEISVMDWMRDAYDLFMKHTDCGEDGGNKSAKMTMEDWEQLWAFTPSVVGKHAAKFRENLEAEEDEEDEDGGDEDEEFEDVTDDAPKSSTQQASQAKEVVQDPIPLDQMLKYLHTGLLPPFAYK